MSVAFSPRADPETLVHPTRERALYRTGAVWAAAGAVVTGVLNALHPTNPEPGNAARYVEFVRNSPTWVPLHWGIALGTLAILGAVVVLARSLRDAGGEAWARLGIALATAGTALWLAVFALEVAVKRMVDAVEQDPSLVAGARALAHLGDGLFSAAILVNWLGTLCLGVAMVMSRRYPAWLAWSGVLHAAAIVFVVALPRAFGGASVVIDTVLFPLLATVSLLWLLALAVVFWRRASG